MRANVGTMLTFVLVAVLARPSLAGRYESYTKKFAAGPKMKAVASASFGEEGLFDFVAAGQGDDQTLIAFGNAWGPAFPRTPAPLVLGRGRHGQLDAFLPDAKHRIALRSDDPDEAGMIVLYSHDLATVKKVVRFDWGVASISTGLVLPDRGGLLVAGRCTELFREAVRNRVRIEPVPSDSSTGPYEYAGVKVPGDVFIAMLPASGDGVLWAIVFEGARIPPQHLWLDYEQNIYADVRGMVRIARGGTVVTRIDTAIETSDGHSRSRTYTASRSANYLFVNPSDGSFYYGGDRPTHTGYEPWRQPYLYKFASDGHRIEKFWDWPAKDVATGGDGIGLCADSAVRAMDLASDGMLLIGTDSSGSNSVFCRQPQTLDRLVRVKGLGMDVADAKSTSSIGYVLKFDPKKHRVVDGTLLAAYVPESSSDKRHRGDVGSIRIQQLKAMADGSVALTGTAGVGLVQTRDAIAAPEGARASGEFLIVLGPDLQTLSYSSYLPGTESAQIQPIPGGLLVLGRKMLESKAGRQCCGRLVLLGTADP